MTFRVNQKVVCVEAFGGIEPRLVRGRVYTIASVRWVEDCNDSFLGVTLAELQTEETDEYYAEFFASRFRPVVDRKTDISTFTKMLNPSLEDMRALIRESVQ